jgi:GNAT superfamily N-acetyltransferase
MAELRARTMRSDLERLGRFDEDRVRSRFLDAYVPAHTRVIVVDSSDAGLVAVRAAEDALWIEHFYLDPRHQGRGIGGEVLARILEDAGAGGRRLRLNVLRGSPAERLYARHGFVVYDSDEIDVFMETV